MSVVSISLDLDNLWSYMKIHGDDGWRSFPSYLDRLSEIVIERLRRHGLRITVFVVGQDTAREKNREALAAFAGAGHEIGNHSFSHEPWFHRYRYEEAEREIALAEEHIEAATGHGRAATGRRGFRSPPTLCVSSPAAATSTTVRRSPPSSARRLGISFFAAKCSMHGSGAALGSVPRLCRPAGIERAAERKEAGSKRARKGGEESQCWLRVHTFP